MHELSIAQSIVESAREHVACHAGRRVLRVGVRVGDVSGVNADALDFCFGMTTRGTGLEGATLDIERVAVRYRCDECDDEFLVAADFSIACPRCASSRTAMTAGDELAISYLELEDDGAEPPGGSGS